MESEAVREFKDGVYDLNNQNVRSALLHLRRAAELDKQNPFYLSYLGLALAMADKNWEQAEDLCYTALKKKRNQPELYLNLAEVFRRNGKKADAIDTLTEGLPLTKRDPRLLKALAKLGMRRAPVLPFLKRDNLLNRKLGKLRSKVLKPGGRTA